MAGFCTGNVTVHASAGTGKTYRLVSRILHLLLAGAAPESILAVTFTHKAAAEMHARLLERLRELAALDGDGLDEALRELELTPGPALRARARNAHERLLRAERGVNTTTFHAFCQQVLRRFPLEADVPPGFALAERTGELAREAWEALSMEAAARPGGPVAQALDTLFIHLGLHNTRQALDAFLARRADWWAWTLGRDDPAEWAAARLRAALEEPLAAPMPPDDESALGALLGDPALDGDLARLAALLELHSTKGNREALERTGLVRAADEALARRWEVLQALCFTTGGDRRARLGPRRSTWPDEAAEFDALFDGLCLRVEQTRDLLNARRTLEVGCAWYRAGARYVEHFQRLKAEQRLLDFTDLEWKTLLLLRHGDNALWVQYKLDARIDHLLFDEFQDTNPTQWQLVLPLLEELAAGGERSRSVFVVGDVKQSIYRFRRAEPRLFEAADRWLQEHAGARPLHMEHSRRSAAAVMEAVNRIFGEGGPFHGRVQDFRRHETVHGDLYGRVVLLPLAARSEKPEPVPFRNPLAEPRPEDPGNRRLEEAAAIAATIRELMAGPFVVGRGEAARPLCYGDIHILLRSRTHAGDFEEALREAGIPFAGAGRGTLLQCLEVRDMEGLLRWLLAPGDDLALAGILRSPLFGVDDGTLQRIAAAGGGDWFSRLEALAGDPVLARAREQLAAWRDLAGRLPVHDLLDRIYSEGNVIARYRAAVPGALADRVEANLARFLELALEVDSGRYPSLGAFLASLKEMRERDESPDEAPAGSGDRVQILTIHGAKGLEAPVVFLADAAACPDSRDTHGALVDWPAEAGRPRLMLPVPPREHRDPLTRTLLAAEAEAEAREEANLLYVALTRARQLLYVSGTRGKGFGESWYAALARLFAGDEQGPEAPLVVAESGTPAAAGAAPSPPAPGPAPDPRLARPLPAPPVRLLELAPSHAAEGPAAPPGDEDGRLYGILVHRLLEHLAGGGDPAGGPPPAAAAALELDPDDPLLAAAWDEARAVVNDPQLATLFRDEEWVAAWSEVPLQYLDGDGRLVHGVVDRLLLAPDRVLVVDYKSHRQARPGNLDELGAAYVEQLRLYAAGARRLWPDRTVEAALLFTACRTLWKVGGTGDQGRGNTGRGRC